jgi:phage terminase small subunit
VAKKDASSKSATRPLSARQRAFVVAYLTDAAGNATKAAELAGYSKKTARAIGAENLTKPDIAAAIAKGIDRREGRAILTADERRQLLSTMAGATGEHPLARLKMDGLYVQKHHLSGTVTLEAILSEARS